jgi:hypothetical protein
MIFRFDVGEGTKMFLMNGKSFVVLTLTNPLLIFSKMNLVYEKSCGYHVSFFCKLQKRR